MMYVVCRSLITEKKFLGSPNSLYQFVDVTKTRYTTDPSVA